MKKGILAGILVLALGPMSAQAVLIEAVYTGTVINVIGDGFGFQVSDTINGRMIIDTSRSGPDLEPGDPDSARYSGDSDVTDWITGRDLDVPSPDKASDSVILSDDPGTDIIFVANRACNGGCGSTPGATFGGEVFTIIADDDFLSGVNLEDLIGVTVDLSNTIVIFDGTWFEGIFDAGGSSVIVEEAEFLLQEVTFRAVGVPAPTTLALLGLGLLGVGYRRRRQH